MVSENLDVLLFISSNEEEVDDKMKLWLENFEYILKVSLNQVFKRELIYKKAFTNDTIPAANVTLQFNIDPNYKTENKFNSPLININCFLNDTNDEANTFSFYNNSKNTIDDLTTDIQKISNDVWVKFSDLCFEIKRLINQVTNEIEKSKKPTIYFAETSSDQEENRNNLIREFRYRGYNTLPNEKLSDDMLQFSEQVQACMDKAIISIHIIGNNYAPVIKNIDVSKVELQNDIFSEVNASTNTSLKRLVLISPQLKVKSKKQRNYIESFKRNIELHKNTEIIQSPLEDFKTIIQKRIDLILNPSKSEFIEKKVNGKFVYLIRNAKNGKLDNFYKSIVDAGYQLIEIDSDRNKINMIKQHQWNLIHSEGIIVEFNSGNYQWLKSKVTDIIKAPGIGRTKQFKFKQLLTFEDVNLGEMESKISIIPINDNKALKQALDKIIES